MRLFIQKIVGLLVLCLFAATIGAEPLPTDEDLADLYSYSCQSCHAVPASGAPQSGDKSAWQPRLKKGIDQLLDNTIDGYKGMPALGSCPNCTAEDFVALINFMSSSK